MNSDLIHVSTLLAVVIPLALVTAGAVAALITLTLKARKKELQHVGEAESARLRIRQVERDKQAFIERYNENIHTQLEKIADTASVSRASSECSAASQEAFGQIEYFANTLLSFTEETGKGVAAGAKEPPDKKLRDRTLAGQRILLAEDNEISREIFYNMLRDEGATVILATNGREAVDIFSSSADNTINIILTDLIMPEMDGYEAAKKIRSLTREDAHSVPIIALTGDAFFLLEDKIRECGMNGYLIKPCEIQSMLRVIMSCLWSRSLKLTGELETVSTDSSIDTLTGTKNRLAYDKLVRTLDEKIGSDEKKPEFGIVICDVNKLKETNDVQGHQAGDQLLIHMARLICERFRTSPVFRIGGDEFAAVLMQEDYEHAEELFNSLQAEMEQAYASGGESFACGMANFTPIIDRNVSSVFYRADAVMYENKRTMKREKK